MNASEKLETRCVVVGGGPAGMMAGYLLARAGVPVVVLEKHADFNRDFRGDTIHPSTLELMRELGLLDQFLEQPHQKLRELRGIINGHGVPIADFSQLPTRCKFIAFIPRRMTFCRRTTRLRFVAGLKILSGDGIIAARNAASCTS